MSNVAGWPTTRNLNAAIPACAACPVQGALRWSDPFVRQRREKKWLPRLHGNAVGCFGLTEPQFGSNPGDAHAR
jgi:alkylation response protein AidB-like acyl-CoA dehydrogenase